MAIDFRTTLTDFYGEEFTAELGKDKDGQPKLGPMTLGRVCAIALSNSIQADQGEDGIKKFERFTLGQKIVAAEKAGTTIDLTAEEIASLKLRVAAVHINVAVIGGAWSLLDPVMGKSTT